MQRIVLFLLITATFLFTSPSWAGNRASWDEAKSQVPSCGQSDSISTNACTAAGKYFCGSFLNDGTCSLPKLPTPSINSQADFDAAVNSALQNCGMTKKTALAACADNIQVGSAPSDIGKGIREMCKQLQTSTDQGQKINSEVAGYCDGKKQRCNYYCGEALEKIKQALGGCPRDDQHCRSGMEQASNGFKELEKNAKSCQALSSETYLAQARATNDASKQSELCKTASNSDPSTDKDASNPNDKSNNSATNDASSQSSAMNPAMLQGLMQMASALMTPQASTEEPTDPSLDSVDCSVNANLAGCPIAKATSDPWAMKPASAGGLQTEDSTGGFDVPDAASTPTDSSMKAASIGTPASVGSVPNGGGGVPQGAGGGAASLGGGGGAGAGPGPVGNKTDVLHGLGSGGGMSAMAAGMNMKNGDGGGGYNYGGHNGPSEDPGLDLSQFLPGGKKDPTRKVAGFEGSVGMQIQSKDVNIWARISERIRTRCSQGLLRDCIP